MAVPRCLYGLLSAANHIGGEVLLFRPVKSKDFSIIGIGDAHGP
jgi:hypothetical protein